MAPQLTNNTALQVVFSSEMEAISLQEIVVYLGSDEFAGGVSG
jgi:hypothetical protein